MVRVSTTIVRLILPALLVAGCGGDKKPVKKPIVKKEKQAEPPPETEADREEARKKQALKIVPDGSACFPQSLRTDSAPKLELAAINKEAVICATDVDRSRLLGPVACWKVDLAAGSITHQAGAAIPGRSVSVKLDDRCARGYCIPKDGKVPEDKIVHMAASPDGTKVVVVAGDDVHIYDASARSRESGFSIRGDKGVTNNPIAVHWIANSIFIEGADAGPASYVFQFKTDGTAVGALMTLGGKETMLNTHGGSFVVLDENRVAVAEKGFSTVTTYQIDTGKRAKIVRRTNNGPCKPAELDAFWTEQGEVGGKCKEHLGKTYGHLIGADAVAGKTNLLVLLRGTRLGELAVLDATNLAEKKSIKLPWCENEGGDDGKGGDKDDKGDKADSKKEEPKAEKAAPPKKAPAKKKGGGDEEPDGGGE